MDTFRWVKAFVCSLGGLSAGLLGGWDLLLKILVIFVCLDYAAGVSAAIVERKLNSQIAFRGVAKKILLFIPIAVAFWIDQLIGQEILRSVAIMFYIANEGISVLENCARVGIPIPEAIKRALAQLGGEEEHGK